MLTIIPNFITLQEEQALLSNLKPSQVKAGSGRNKILRFGSDLPYKSLKSKEIPKWLHDICFRVGLEWRSLGFKPTLPDHVTINEYLPGQSIDWHIDSKGSGPIITVLSLESPVTLGLRPEDKSILDGDEALILPERSLLHMTNYDRWHREHCTLPAQDHRWSIVFRKGTENE